MLFDTSTFWLLVRSTLQQRFIAEGGPSAAAAAVTGIGKESDIIIMAFGMLETFSSVGVPLDADVRRSCATFLSVGRCLRHTELCE